MPVDYATTYTEIHATDVFHCDRVACDLNGTPIRTRLALNEALAHGTVEWKTVEDHFLSTDLPDGNPPPDGHVLIVFDDDGDVTLPVDAVIYAYQS